MHICLTASSADIVPAQTAVYRENSHAHKLRGDPFRTRSRTSQATASLECVWSPQSLAAARAMLRARSASPPAPWRAALASARAPPPPAAASRPSRARACASCAPNPRGARRRGRAAARRAPRRPRRRRRRAAPPPPRAPLPRTRAPPPETIALPLQSARRHYCSQRGAGKRADARATRCKLARSAAVGGRAPRSAVGRLPRSGSPPVAWPRGWQTAS
eukprot:6201063-Pleurochrysis_carterae.AAC.4